jgi:tRNA-modifying protein YgfZ
MFDELRALQAKAGAVFSSPESTTTAVAMSYGNDSAALEAARLGVAVCDRSHWGRILVGDADRLRFLHNQSTNDFNSLKPGQGCDTVFVTSTGRTIDLVSAYVMDDGVLLLVSPNRRDYLMTWMDRFIFFSDRVSLKDITETTATFSLIGPDSTACLEKLGGGAIATQPYASHALTNLAGIEVRVAVGSGLASTGYTLIMDSTQAASLWQALTTAGAVPLGATAWEQLRIEQGRPAPDHELTEDINPLEAGLWQTISLTKGCYIGQETIARLHTYRGVKQQLWGIRLTAPVEPGTLLTVGDEKVGTLTSLTQTPDGVIGLAYIRTKAATAGLKVTAGASEGELVAVPFVSHEYI